MREFLTRPTDQKRKKRIGRGGVHGKTSGRGHKGQRARAGNKVRPAVRDELQRIPKRRGFSKNRSRTVWAERPKPIAIPLSRVISLCDEEETSITPKLLVTIGACRMRDGRVPAVKLVGTDSTLTRSLHCVGCGVSAGAKACIEKAGGTIS